MPKTIESVTVTYTDGTSAVLTQGELRSPFAPGGKIILDAPKAPTGKEVAANPAAYEGTSFDFTLTAAVPSMFRGNRIPPTWKECWAAPPTEDYVNTFTSLAEEIFQNMLGARVNTDKLTSAQKARIGLS